MGSKLPQLPPTDGRVAKPSAPPPKVRLTSNTRAEVAAELAPDDRGEAASLIRDLVTLCKAYESLCVAYRTGAPRPPAAALDAIQRLKWRLE